MANLLQTQNELQGIQPIYILPATFILPSFHLFSAQLDWLVQLLDISNDSKHLWVSLKYFFYSFRP